jgi:SprT protein
MVSSELKAKAEKKMMDCIFLFNAHFAVNCPIPTVEYDLKGKTAGQAWPYKRKIRLNAYLLETYKDSFIDRTVVHETAHLCVDYYHDVMGRSLPKPHGKEWKHVMALFGISNPDRCHSYKTQPARKTRNFVYTCGCKTIHSLGIIRHNRYQSKKTFYRCNICKTRLIFTGEETC